MSKEKAGKVKARYATPVARSLMQRRQHEVMKNGRDKQRNRRSKAAKRLKARQLKGE